MKHDDDGSFLNANNGNPDNFWNGNNRFVFLRRKSFHFSPNKRWLEDIRQKIEVFLKDELYLELHPDKTSITTISSGIDFLGWVHFPDHRVLRTKTKRECYLV